MAGSVRPSVRLTEQEAARLQMAAARNGTTVSALLRQGAQQVAEPEPDVPTVARLRQWDEQSGLLVALLSRLDGLGMTDALPETRRHLARATQVRDAAAAEAYRAEDGRASLVAGLVSGEVGAAEAAQRDVQFAPWLDGGRPALRLGERAMAELGSEARRAAVGDSVAAHDALAERLDAAVGRAVEAGGRIVDVPRMVEILSPAWQRRPRTSSDSAGVMTSDPWVESGPKLPGLSMEDLQGDAERMSAWATSTAAMDELDQLWEVAELLGQVGGWSFARWDKAVNGDVLYLVGRDLPRQVWLAVVAGCGWRPGLILAAGRRPEPPVDRESRVRQWGAAVLGLGR